MSAAEGQSQQSRIEEWARESLGWSDCGCCMASTRKHPAPREAEDADVAAGGADAGAGAGRVREEVDALAGAAGAGGDAAEAADCGRDGASAR